MGHVFVISLETFWLPNAYRNLGPFGQCTWNCNKNFGTLWPNIYQNLGHFGQFTWHAYQNLGPFGVLFVGIYETFFLGTFLPLVWTELYQQTTWSYKNCEVTLKSSTFYRISCILSAFAFMDRFLKRPAAAPIDTSPECSNKPKNLSRRVCLFF